MTDENHDPGPSTTQSASCTAATASGHAGGSGGTRRSCSIRPCVTATDHLEALHKHDPGLRIDAVVADPSAVEDTEQLAETASRMGARLLLRQVRLGDGTARHDALRLAAAYRDVFDDFLGDVGTRAG